VLKHSDGLTALPFVSNSTTLVCVLILPLLSLSVAKPSIVVQAQAADGQRPKSDRRRYSVVNLHYSTAKNCHPNVSVIVERYSLRAVGESCGQIYAAKSEMNWVTIIHDA
jgi:hypothetical protein